MPSHLVPPYGGTLKQLLAEPERAQQLREMSRDLPSWDLTPRQVCDLELLLNGGFSPLEGFLTKAEYESVCRDMRLPDGTIWPMPIILDVTEEMASRLQPGRSLALRDAEGVMLAVLHVEDIWRPDLQAEARQVFGTTNSEHPGVGYLCRNAHTYYLGGKVEGIGLPQHYDWPEARHSPAQLRERFASMGWRRVVAFQTRNPMHRAHQELTFRAARQLEANLLIHPVVGMTKPGDVDHYTRVRCYQALLKHYPRNTAMLSLLPLAMCMGGPARGGLARHHSPQLWLLSSDRRAGPRRAGL